eukprot:8470622-Pyramimonas_sp.AAC.1
MWLFSKNLPLGLRPKAPATRKAGENPEPIAQIASKTAKMASKMVPRRLQDGHEGPETAQNGRKISPRRLKMHSRR